MKTSVNLNPKSIGKSISKLFYRYHIVLFVVTVLGGMAVLILMLSNTLAIANDTTATDITPVSSFDQATIDQLNQLNIDRPQVSPEFNQRLNSDRRNNPFVE